MMIVYRTGHSCQPNQVISYRYWVIDTDDKQYDHVGVCDIDQSFMSLLVKYLLGEFIKLNIYDDEFKKFLFSLGYTQREIKLK